MHEILQIVTKWFSKKQKQMRKLVKPNPNKKNKGERGVLFQAP